MYQEILKQIGLTDNEALVYETLLKLGPSSVGRIIKKTKVKRGNTYNILYSLIDKGLVLSQTKEKKTFFQVESPDHLLDLILEREKFISQIKKNLANIMPSLKSEFHLTTKRPAVRYYEGIEGIKKIYLDTIKEKENIYAFESIEAMNVVPKLKKWIMRSYVPKRIKNKILAWTIVSESKDKKETEEFKKADKKCYRESLIVPRDKYIFEIETNIYGNKIFFASFKDKIGIIIENPAISRTMKNFWKLTWDLAKKKYK